LFCFVLFCFVSLFFGRLDVQTIFGNLTRFGRFGSISVWAVGCRLSVVDPMSFGTHSIVFYRLSVSSIVSSPMNDLD
jgi:hypothetical protein